MAGALTDFSQLAALALGSGSPVPSSLARLNLKPERLL
jgi:hypothetical protein